MGRTLCLAFCILLNILFVRGLTYTSVVNTKSGPVRGIISTTIENVKYAAFKGIPYAKPPVKYLRFKPPVETDDWTDVYNAVSDASVCTQFNSTDNSIIGSEDCLYINVFTPHTQFNDSIAAKPVMIWIYGGSFTTGYSNASFYGPDFIVGEDVILVSFNYRLDTLGFLNLEHENATGNYGLKDQNLALKWVKKNIAQFGGNPDKITIFGQSAGGISVDAHVLSDMSVGLFKQSISMSGSTLCLLFGNLQSGTEAVNQAFRLGLQLGTNANDKEILLNTLYETSAADIILATKRGSLSFAPSLEKTDIAIDQEKFLTECTLKKYTRGNYTKGPHMMGFTTNETVYFAGRLDQMFGIVELALSSIGNATSEIPFLSELREAIANGKEKWSQDTIYKLIQLTSDLLLILPIDYKQKVVSRNNDYPIYYYRFSFDSKYSLHRALGVDLNGVGHADELPYLFYMPWVNLPVNDTEIATTRKRVVKLWTNFAKYGNPTPECGDDEILGINWPDSRHRGDHLDIGKDLTTGPRPTDRTVEIVQLSGICTSPSLSRCEKVSE